MKKKVLFQLQGNKPNDRMSHLIVHSANTTMWGEVSDGNLCSEIKFWTPHSGHLFSYLIKNVIAPYYKKNEQKDINTVSTMNCSKLKVIRKQLNVFHTLIN